MIFPQHCVSGKSAMWELALVVLQVACLAILVAAVSVSISLPRTSTKGPTSTKDPKPKLKRTA
jgi:hypothetical protein